MRSTDTALDARSLGGLRATLSRRFRELTGHINVVLQWRPGIRDGAEILLLVSTLLPYFLVRGLTQTHVDTAVSHGVRIVHIEQSLGIFWEARLQSWVLSYSLLVTFLNDFYLYGHLPVIGALAVWMYFRHRPQYVVMRNAFLISGAIALIFYVSFPTAPPRLLPDNLGFHFVDTIYRQYGTDSPDGPSWFVNEYADFPSLHIGWNLLVGVSIFLATRNVFMRIFAVAMPIVMFAVIILTANHYLLDAAGGCAVMLIGLGIAFVGKASATRIVSSDSRAARQKGCVGWIYWLCGVAEPDTGYGRTRNRTIS